jgi:hypothetical protein
MPLTRGALPADSVITAASRANDTQAMGAIVGPRIVDGASPKTWSVFAGDDKRTLLVYHAVALHRGDRPRSARAAQAMEELVALSRARSLVP